VTRFLLWSNLILAVVNAALCVVNIALGNGQAALLGGFTAIFNAMVSSSLWATVEAER
jgi:O-antigen/teichoic acid export membrane protein